MDFLGRVLARLPSFGGRGDTLKAQTNIRATSCILEHKPGGRKVVYKTRTTPPRIAVSYDVLRPQTRN